MSGFMAYPEAATWLYATLTGVPITGVLDVYEDAAPEGLTAKGSLWIEFETLAAGTDVAEVAEQRIWTEFPVLVRAVTRGRSTEALKAVATEIDNRLQRASGTTSAGQVIQSARSQEHQDHWIEQGVEYRALGGLYHLIVQPLNP
ncbi:MAG: hypothetical protein ACYDCI_05780 [Candidatus Limnocylindrales bacterium]